MGNSFVAGAEPRPEACWVPQAAQRPATNTCFVAKDSHTRRVANQSAPSSMSTIGTTRTEATHSVGA